MTHKLCTVSVRTGMVREVSSERILLYFVGSQIHRLPIRSFGFIFTAKMSSPEESNETPEHCNWNAMGADRRLLSCCESGFVCARVGDDRDRARWEDRRRGRCVCPGDADSEEHRERTQEGGC